MEILLIKSDGRRSARCRIARIDTRKLHSGLIHHYLPGSSRNP